MSEKRFVVKELNFEDVVIEDTVTKEQYNEYGVMELLNTQQATINALKEEKEYWESKAMTLLMQVRRLTSRMTDKEVKEFSKELEDE